MRQTGRRLQVGIGIVLTVVGFGVIGVTAQNGGLEMIQGFYEEPTQFYSGGPRRPRSILQNFAVDRMLKDKGFVRSIINCVLDKGPCESNGRKLRLMAPEILRGQCPGCSRTVHQQIRKVISHVQRNFPVEWSEVTRRFMSYSSGQNYAPPQPAYSPPPQQNFNPGQPQAPAYNQPQLQPPSSFNPPQQQPPPQQQYNPDQNYNPDPNVYQNYG